MANKKRTSLDALGLNSTVSSPKVEKEAPVAPQLSSNTVRGKSSALEAKKATEKPETAKTTVYVPRSVFEQWRELAFTERKKMHDYLLEGLDRVFADRGLKSISELKSEE